VIVLLVIGISLILIAILVKTVLIHEIWKQTPKGEASPNFDGVSEYRLALYSGILFIFQMIIIGAWLGTSTMIADIAIIDSLDRVAFHYCTTDTSPWQYIEIIFLGLLLLSSMYFSYVTRDFWIKQQLPNESQNFLTSAYNTIFWSLVLLPMIMIISGSLDATYFLEATAIIFPTAFALVNIFTPKYLFIFDSISGARDKIAGFLSVHDQAGNTGYSAPASGDPISDDSIHPGSASGSGSNSREATPIADVSTRTIRAPDLPTLTETEEKKETPLAWNRRLNQRSVTAPGETGRDSPSATDVLQEPSELDDSNRRQMLQSSSMEMVKLPITVNEEELWVV